MSRVRWAAAGAILLAVLALGGTAAAQELEPRAFSPVPVGLNFLALITQYSSGDLVLGGNLPVEDATARVFGIGPAYAHVFDVFGMTAKAWAAAPYAHANASGLVGGEPTEKKWDGFVDPVVGFAVNFLGAPALTPKEFASYKQGTILGASVQISIPIGKYDNTRIINLGQNRWSFRPRVGVSQALGQHFIAELTLGGWFFTANTDYRQGHRLTQEAIVSVQTILVYQFRRGLWLSANANFYRGGTAEIDGVSKHDLQSNNRGGLTLAVPVARGHSIKAAFDTGVVVTRGTDFDTFTLAYQFAW